MKKVMFLIILITSLAVCKAQVIREEEIFNIESTGFIHKNSLMIDDFEDKDVVSRLKYKPSNPYQFTVGSTTYTLKTCVFEDWDDYTYGFNVISIYKDNRLEFELKQSELWTYAYGGPSSVDFREYTDIEYCIPIKLTDSVTALVFLGWPYGGDMPYLTIIVATETDVNIVFNKRMGLSAILPNYPYFKMKVQTVLEEYDSCGKLCTPPVYTEIGPTGYGTLYIKQ